MKKFQFPLEKLLSYKNQILESEMQILSELNLEHQMALEKLNTIQRNYDRCKEKLNDKLSTRATPSEIQLYRHYIVDLNEQIKAAQRQIDCISMKIVEQVGVVKQLKVETKTIENLRENRLDDFKRAETKREENAIDEFVSAAKYY